jgi:hypothetical protein
MKKLESQILVLCLLILRKSNEKSSYNILFKMYIEFIFFYTSIKKKNL